MLNWIKNNIYNGDLILNNYGTIFSGIYSISFNNICVYIGESREVYNRLYKHMYNLRNNPYKFGINKYEINKDIKISIDVLERVNSDKYLLKMKELEYINKYNPILQLVTSDRCIKQKIRRKAIEDGVLLKQTGFTLQY